MKTNLGREKLRPPSCYWYFEVDSSLKNRMLTPTNERSARLMNDNAKYEIFDDQEKELAKKIGTQTHTNAPLQRFANHALKYCQAARVESRPLTVAKGYTLATRAAERTHCGRV